MFDDQSVLKTEAGEATIDEAAATPSLEEQVAAANARADENYGKFLLAVADFDNYKKRIQRDMDSIVSSRRRMLLERLLPVLDNLQRALNSNAGRRHAAQWPRTDSARFRSRTRERRRNADRRAGRGLRPAHRRGRGDGAVRRRRRRYDRRRHREGIQTRRRLASSGEGYRSETL